MASFCEWPHLVHMLNSQHVDEGYNVIWGRVVIEFRPSRFTILWLDRNQARAQFGV